MLFVTEDTKLTNWFERLLLLVTLSSSQRLRLPVLKNLKYFITHQISSTDILRHNSSSKIKAANSLNNTDANLRTRGKKQQ